MNESDRPTTSLPANPEDLSASGADALIGATLHDTYKVVRFLAEGGMGRVYEAQHTRISTKRFAIKVLHSELKHSLEVRMRFRREAEAAASIDHPCVVGVHDFGYSEDGRPYLVSDYLEGCELGTLLDEGKPLATSVATSIARQLCRALEAAHDKGVIHRDLKPQNVFLVGSLNDPEVRVLDFGLSRIVELAETSVTQTGMVMGTPQYMAPEQARGERADHRIDIYGVGAVLYASITGRPPFDEESPHQTVLAVMSREPPRPCSIVSSVPPELEVIVQRAMARIPDDRYGTMKELEAALVRFDEMYAKRMGARQVSLPDSMPTSARQVSSADVDEARGVRRRTAGWLSLAGALLIVGGLSAALGTYSILSPKRPLLPTELLLASLAVLGSVFTPGILLVSWLRRRYWTNSAKMVGLVSAVRAPVVAGVFAYGVAALFGRALDATSPHITTPVHAPNASGWIGWAPFLFGFALIAGLAAILRVWILSPTATSFARRFVAGPVLVGAVVAGGVAVMGTGYRMSTPLRDSIPEPPVAVAEPPVATATAQPPPTATSRPVKPASKPTASASVPAVESSSPLAAKDRAPKADLEAAIKGGIPPLSALQSRFPKDPAVLKPLALALGKEPEQASELLRVLDTLFTEVPDEAKDDKLAELVKNAALTPATSPRAIDLMRARMGLKGAEMLFDLMLSVPETRGRAKAALETSEVQRILSPALKIAYDLYAAPSCAARVELLPQAARDGDERSVTVLTIFMSKTHRGCGPKRNKPCPAPCDKEAPAFEATMKKIRDKQPPEPKK